MHYNRRHSIKGDFKMNIIQKIKTVIGLRDTFVKAGFTPKLADYKAILKTMDEAMKKEKKNFK